MAAKHYTCKDLDDEIDFSKETREKIKAIVNEILCRQIELGTRIGILEELFNAKVKNVRTNHVEEIVDRLIGKKMTFKQLQDVILSYF